MNPATPRPSVAGTYIVEAPVPPIRTETTFYAYWTGARWCPATRNAAETRDARYRQRIAKVQNKRWRDVT